MDDVTYIDIDPHWLTIGKPIYLWSVAEVLIHLPVSSAGEENVRYGCRSYGYQQLNIDIIVMLTS